MEKNYEDFKEALLKGNLALVLTSVSKSGMTRTFKVFYKNKKEQYCLFLMKLPRRFQIEK
ncbi:hypothetical protein ACNGAN_10115 [Campylobacter coli]